MIATINISDIESLYERRGEVAQLLHLEEFTDKISTKEACQSMRKKGIRLNLDTARGMGHLGRLFGLHCSSVQEVHIYEFIIIPG
jgi:hypothetical protein